MGEFLERYLVMQKENAKFKNRIIFLMNNYKYLSKKQIFQYFFKYSPTINQVPMGKALAEGIKEGFKTSHLHK